MTELAIRLRRAAFNQAIADADVAAIGSILAENAVMVTGADSAVIAGRKAQLLVWRREFAAKGRMVYERLPGRIELSPVEPIALEQGTWTGTAPGLSAGGSYVAKWREVRGAWVIEAEVYLTLEQ